MKAIFLVSGLLFGALLMCSEQLQNNPNKKENVFTNYGIRTIEFEGCEYILYRDFSGNGIQLIHKQNCKFCTERNPNK